MSNLRRRACIASLALVAAPFVMTEPAAAGGGCHRGAEEGQTEGTGTTVNLEMNCMNPTVLHAEAGEEITFVNRDKMMHNLYGVGWGFDSVDGGGVTHVFDESGTYPYACLIHPGMVGAVVVGDGESAAAAAPVQPPEAAGTVESSSGISGLTAGAAAGALALGAALLLKLRSRRVHLSEMPGGPAENRGVAG